MNALLIDACVMECCFHNHMAERNLLFHDTVAEALKKDNSDATEAEQLTDIEALDARLKAAGIPDLLGVILKEVKV